MQTILLFKLNFFETFLRIIKSDETILLEINVGEAFSSS